MKESMNCLLNKYFNLEMTEIVFDKTISFKKVALIIFTGLKNLILHFYRRKKINLILLLKSCNILL